MLLTREDKPSEALKVVHLQRPTENDLLKAACDRLNGLFELQLGNVSRNLLEVERAIVRIKFVKLGANGWLIVTLR